jgi:hypothetical protein
MKTIKELKVALNGPLWRVHEMEIEAIDVIDLWQEQNGESGHVEVKDFNLSDDEILDVFIHLGAPNGTAYTVTISGKVSNGGADDVITYEKNFIVERKGRLRIDISKNISELV